MTRVKKIYNGIGSAEVLKPKIQELEWAEDLSEGYHIAYVGKHKAISPLDSDKKLEPIDFEPDLLIECRLFNENKELFIYPHNGKVMVRTIEDGISLKHLNIEKAIQLRNIAPNNDNKKLVIRHYIGEDGGYSMVRFLKVI